MNNLPLTQSEMEAKEKAQALFKSGYNCSQAVFATFAADLGLDTETALRIAQPFGGGMGRMREVCGTVSGMLMAAGLAEGHTDPADKEGKTAVYTLTQQLAGKFREQNGSLICRELLGLVPMGNSEKSLKEGTAQTHVIESPVSSERTAEYYKKRPCVELVGQAAVIFQHYLDSLHPAPKTDI